MVQDVYQLLCETMAERGGLYPGTDVPEFYELAYALFNPDEAAVTNAMPRGFNSAKHIAERMNWSEDRLLPIIESMAEKGLCMSLKKEERILYAGLPFVPGIFEYQFMRGTDTEKDRKIALLIRKYKDVLDEKRTVNKNAFPVMRVIPIHKTLKAQNRIHTYDQVKSYIDRYTPLAVSTCYCRHQAKLIDASDHCGNPDDVCIQFGMGAQFVIDRKMGKEISAAEAVKILDRSEKAGLVHCTNNRQEIDFLCNCCSCHCVILKNAAMHPKPGLAINSGFEPDWDEELCTACGTCLERCPMDAIEMAASDQPVFDFDRCIGCGVCATGCPSDALFMVEKPGFPEPPADRKALKAAIKKRSNTE